MGIDFAGDLAETLSADDHGALVTHAVAGETEGILNNEFLSVDPGGLVEVSASEPAVYVPDAWAAQVGRNDTITVTPTDKAGDPIPGQAQTFRVATGPESDGVGLSRIALLTV